MEEEGEKIKSLDPDEASFRLIKPDKNTLSGYPVTMYNFMPTDKLMGMEDVRAGHCVLDLGAAPKGKALAFLQTLYPSVHTCNDSE